MWKIVAGLSVIVAANGVGAQDGPLVLSPDELASGWQMYEAARTQVYYPGGQGRAPVQGQPFAGWWSTATHVRGAWSRLRLHQGIVLAIPLFIEGDWFTKEYRGRYPHYPIYSEEMLARVNASAMSTFGALSDARHTSGLMGGGYLYTALSFDPSVLFALATDAETRAVLAYRSELIRRSSADIRIYDVARMGLTELDRFARRHGGRMAPRAAYLRSLIDAASKMSKWASTAHEKNKKVVYVLAAGGLNVPAESLGERTELQDSLLETMGASPDAPAIGCWPALVAEYAKRETMTRGEAYNCVRAVVLGLRIFGPPEDATAPRNHALNLCRHAVPRERWNDIDDWLDRIAREEIRWPQPEADSLIDRPPPLK